MTAINSFTKSIDFAEKFQLKKVEYDRQLKGSIQKNFLEITEKYLTYQDKIDCFHASVFKYIYITLYTIESYLDKISNGSKSDLEILILTTQLPSSFKPTTIHSKELNPYFNTPSALADYYTKFKELTTHPKIKVKRYILCDDEDDSINTLSQTIKTFYTRADLQMCFCNKSVKSVFNGLKPEDRIDTKYGKCNRPCSEISCKKNREEFLESINTDFFYCPINTICHSSDEFYTINPEIRELIAFKFEKNWEQAYTSNLLDSTTSMFIKFWDNKSLMADNFNFAGCKDISFTTFIDEVTSKNKQSSLKELWGINTISKF